MAKTKKKKRNQASGLVPLIILLIALLGAVAGLAIALSRQNQRMHTLDESSLAPQTLPPLAETTTLPEITDMTTSTSTAETTTEPLPPGSVTGISLSFYRASLHTGVKPVMPIVTMYPKDALDKTEIWESTDTSVATVDRLGNITPVGPGVCKVRVTSASNPKVFAEVDVTVTKPEETILTTLYTPPATTTTTTATVTEPAVQPAAETTTATVPQIREDIQVIDGITYVQGVLIANKTYELPPDYNPGLLPEAEAAFNEMAAAAAEDGLSLTIVSGFRSYDFQKQLYERYCERDGKEAADRYSARAGHSEHQTGLAMDINYAGDAFNDTPEAAWIAENCWKYGFILRYPKDKEEITGYKYESWHVRYLGKEWAKTIYDSGLTLEEYFGITSEYVS